MASHFLGLLYPVASLVHPSHLSLNVTSSRKAFLFPWVWTRCSSYLIPNALCYFIRATPWGRNCVLTCLFTLHLSCPNHRTWKWEHSLAYWYIHFACHTVRPMWGVDETLHSYNNYFLNVYPGLGTPFDVWNISVNTKTSFSKICIC